ncbi:PQQ-binding-like beta-propeller repeat protein [candidate division WOR-3 bacterium]|nr:PQQ-binding-like beta-propeller repeat protein [candidate division WOR-3 bacterium]MCK4328611.1 PQQ-binding-like beta-propeller repeat protein [candidate division WOR-3 bacterium]
MKGLFIAIIIMLLVIGYLGLNAQKEEMVQTEPEIKLELVWEKEFEEEITDFAINVAKDGETYPGVVTLISKALIFSETNEQIKEIKRSPNGSNFFTISESDNHIIHSWQYASEYAKELEECIVSIYDLSGELVWKTHNIAPTRFPKLSPNGKYLIGASYAEVLLVKKDGTFEFINPRKSKRRSLMRIFFTISGDSKFWAISFGEPYADESVQLVVYDPNGDEMFRKVMQPRALAYELEITNDGEKIGVIAPENGKNLFYLFDNNGNLLWKVGEVSRTDHQIVFSPSNNYVLIADAWGSFTCFETASGKEIWYHNISKEEFIITQDPGIGFIPDMEITFSPDERLIAVGVRNRKTNTDCFILFKSNRGLANTFSLPPSNKGFIPKIKFASIHNHFYISSCKKILKFSLGG